MKIQDTTRIAIYGANGRMGQSLLLASQYLEDINVVAVLIRSGSHQINQQVAVPANSRGVELVYQASLNPHTVVDVLIDFSTGASFDNALAIAIEKKAAFVSGTTGLNVQQKQALQNAANKIAVLWSANFSLGITLLKQLVSDAAKALGTSFDAEIIEMHHYHKEDAPSGTALALGQAIASARGQNFHEIAKYTRHGMNGIRPAGEIGFSTIRGGDVVGEHTVMFIAPGERIEITHRAGTRDLFARGALRAAQWLKGKPAGFYSIEDVISVHTSEVA